MLPPPYTLGLPEQYTDWRTNQEQAMEAVVDCTRRVHTAVAPTGAGKSLIYMATAMYTDWRTCVLTATKALQDQLARDYGELACVVKGKQAYTCRVMQYSDCSQGLCNFGVHCNLKEAGCYYYDQLRKARAARIVITNYHFWCANNRLPQTSAQEKIGAFDLLVCDEAHNAPAITGDMFTVEFNKKRWVDRQVLDSFPWTKESSMVIGWLAWLRDTATSRFRELKAGIGQPGQGGSAKQAWMWQDLAQRGSDALVLMQAQAAGKDTVLCVPEKPVGMVRIAPMWPFERGGKLLMADVPRVLMTSATVRPKTMGLLGLQDEDFELIEYPHTFPAANRRLTWLPTVRMNKDTDSMEMRLWQLRIDQILRTRMDRKGVVHTVSYDRQDQVIRGSQYAADGYLMGHAKGEVEQAVESFKDSVMPRCLVSPSVGTGYDFPADQCRFQIITKLPFPDLRDKLMAARCKEDEDLSSYMCMTELVQAAGRGVRSSTDWCENFVIDDSINWFMKRHGKFAPKWFRDAYAVRVRDDVPEGRGL